MKTVVCAPAKVILFGEHFVVYGADGIAAAIKPLNRMQVEIEEGDEQLEYTTTQKQSCITQSAKECKKTTHPISALYCNYVERGKLKGAKIRTQVKNVWELKGVGNSASLSACFAYALRELRGLSLDKGQLFDDVQIAETAAHTSPSGIDAAATINGGILEFKKDFETNTPRIESVEFNITDNYRFILIDTYKKDKERSNTKEMIARFAQANSIEKPPEQLTQQQRDEINKEYQKIFKQAKDALKIEDMNSLGDAMNQNHLLLQKSEVSSPSIELAVKTAIGAGANGAKLTAAGGVGGAVIALCKKEDCEKIENALMQKGFGTHKFEISKKGVEKEII